ncbi:MAG: ANL family adenylate-forming protein [Nitrospirales bacterium]
MLERLQSYGTKEALVVSETSYSYADLDLKRLSWLEYFKTHHIDDSPQVIGVQGDYSLDSISLLLAIWSVPSIAILIPNSPTNEAELLEEAKVGTLFRFHPHSPLVIEKSGHKPSHSLLQSLIKQNLPGLILCSSGSSGRPKAILHNTEKFLEKFKTATKPFRTLAFLLFDHVAGLDTLLYTFLSGGTLIVPNRRDPAHICQIMQDHHVEVLPTSPSFLRLLCISGEDHRHNLSSLQIITYGSEPMDTFTLETVHVRFPGVRLIQKYGSTEFGSPRSQARDDQSLWVKLNSEHVQTKVIDNMLWVKTDSAMMGYLNAPSPQTEDGWFPTGDEVDVDGEWIRILGRNSEIIIVGGEKVYPAEVESVICEMESVDDVLVKGEPHILTGNIVVAKVSLNENESIQPTEKEIRKYCRGRLAPYKIPMKVEFTTKPTWTSRYKKIRA